jgi:hypothetical protein
MSSAITNYTEQRAWLELLGGVGAAILGAGVALVFRHVLAPLAVPLLLVGLVAHGLGDVGEAPSRRLGFDSHAALDPLGVLGVLGAHRRARCLPGVRSVVRSRSLPIEQGTFPLLSGPLQVTPPIIESSGMPN